MIEIIKGHSVPERDIYAFKDLPKPKPQRSFDRTFFQADTRYKQLQDKELKEPAFPVETKPDHTELTSNSDPRIVGQNSEQAKIQNEKSAADTMTKNDSADKRIESNGAGKPEQQETATSSKPHNNKEIEVSSRQNGELKQVSTTSNNMAEIISQPGESEHILSEKSLGVKVEKGIEKIINENVQDKNSNKNIEAQIREIIGITGSDKVRIITGGSSLTNTEQVGIEKVIRQIEEIASASKGKSLIDINADIEKVNTKAALNSSLNPEALVNADSPEQLSLNSGKEVKVAEANTPGGREFSNGEFSKDPGNNFSKEFQEAAKNIKTEVTTSVLGSSGNIEKTELFNAKGEKVAVYQNVRPEEFTKRTLSLAGKLSQNGSSTAKLILNPPSLGNITIDMSMVSDKLNLNIKAESREVIKSIENQLAVLKEKLGNLGIKTDQVEIKLKNNENNYKEQGRNNFNESRNNRQDSLLKRQFVRSFIRQD